MLLPSALSLARQITPRRYVSCCAGNNAGLTGVGINRPIRFLSSAQSTKNGTISEDDTSRAQSLTMEEVHSMREGLQRAATKSKNMIEHEEKMKIEQALAERKRVEGDRKNAARAVPHLLGTDLVLFRNVLAELNLTASSAFDDNRTKASWMEYLENSMGEDADDSFTHYRAIYLDSIPSFAKMLANDPVAIDRLMQLDGLNDNSSERSTLGIMKEVEHHEEPISKTEEYLDKLAAAGFADLRWAKDHLRVPKQKKKLARLERVQRKKEGELRKLQAHLVAQIQKREKLERENKAPEASAGVNETIGNDNSSTGESNMLKNVFGQITSLFHGISRTPAVSSKETQEVSVEECKQLRKIRNKIAFDEKRKLGLTRQLESIKAECESVKPALSDAEYGAANKAARSILSELCPAFAAHMKKRHAKMIEQYQVLDKQTDLTKPHEWYPRTRLTRRKIIFHGGPTNSGKSYTALQRLRDAKRGLYLGPLRLLAAEVYETLTSQGVYTNLLTGQEKRVVPFSTHSSATVEMASTDEEYDIVVIDEIQMISDPERGFAWTRALLGIQSKEIHVCGGLEAHDLVKKFAAACGDEFEFKEYSRFSELRVADKPLCDVSNKSGSYAGVEPGDCVVAFSRNDIFAIKREIEKNTDHKCCVIYGTLPPQIRADQARKFNDPKSKYNILVASDAIGMGLNLNIRRIIFNSLFKSNSESIERLNHSSVKQIAGRAGRRNSPYPNGVVTCRDPADMAYLRKCMSTDISPIERGGLIPTAEHFEQFSAAAEKYDFGEDAGHKLHRVIDQFSEMAKLKGNFFMCRRSHLQLVAEWMDDLPLSIEDKYAFCMSPVNERCQRSSGLLKNFAEKHALGEVFGLNTRTFTPKGAKTFEHLSRLCSMHQELELFLWLNMKFPGNAVEQITAEQLKERTIELINEGLVKTERLRLDHNYIRRDQRLRKAWKKEREKSDRSADDADLHDFVHTLDENDDLLQEVEIDDV